MNAHLNDHAFSADAMLDMMSEHVNRYRVDDHVITYCNAAWAAAYGVDRDDAIGRRVDEFLSPDEIDGLESQLLRLGSGTPVLTDATPRSLPGGADRWLEWVDRYLPSDGGAEILSVGRDVTDRRHAERQLAQSESLFRDLADKSTDVVWRLATQPHTHFAYISPSIDQFLGYPAGYLVDDVSRIREILDVDGGDALASWLTRRTFAHRFDLPLRRRDGTMVIGETSITRLDDAFQGVTRDVTELRQLQASTAALALRDPLTGLANRRRFDQIVATESARASRVGNPISVAYIDLDRLKRINDRFGHLAGDRVLEEIARRLERAVGGADVVARLGGDEFAVVFDASDPSHDRFAERLDETIAAPIMLSDGVVVRCTASIGVADTGSAGSAVHELLAAADQAMYVVKQTRRDASTPRSN
ncbi:MAG: sensor domain-containing diguanylate cyclase [Ilumatobacteraceae bacterium]